MNRDEIVKEMEQNSRKIHSLMERNDVLAKKLQEIKTGERIVFR